MDANSFILNNIFEENAKTYQTKPVRATKYKPGMETGWVVYMSNEPENDLENNLHEGMKFFDTEQEAWDYINADNKQYINKDGKTVEIAVVYEKPMPVLHRKEINPSNKVGIINCFEGKYALLSNETEIYDFFILRCNHETPDEWIIQDADGNIRVWNPDCRDCCGEEFFGRDDNYICERTADNTYIEVAV
jgi:hypothetical protein